MDTAKALKEMMETAGIRSQSALSRASGVPQPTISRILKGEIEAPELPTLKKLAYACQQPLEALISMDGFRDVQKIMPGTIPPGAIRIPHITITAQAGIDGFAINQIDPSEEKAPSYITETELLKLGCKAGDILETDVKGDSMEPGLIAGDVIRINTADKEPKDGKVFVLNYEGEVVVKRLFKDGGRWIIRSDNPDKARHPDRTFTDTVFIIGRVVEKKSVWI